MKFFENQILQERLYGIDELHLEERLVHKTGYTFTIQYFSIIKTKITRSSISSMSHIRKNIYKNDLSMKMLIENIGFKVQKIENNTLKIPKEKQFHQFGI